MFFINLSERALSGAYGSHNSAERSAIMYSFIGSCKINGINPEEWLEEVLRKISDTKLADLHLLLPNNWKKSE